MMGRAGDRLTPLADSDGIDPARLFAPRGSSAEPVRNARPRIIAIAFAMVAAVMVLTARAADLAIFRVDPHFRERPTNTAVLHPRGRIVDRNGELLAGNLRTWNVYVKRKEVDDPVRLANRLGALQGVPPARVLEQRLQGHKGRARIARNVTPKQKLAIFDLAEPGIQFEPHLTRFYPNGDLAAHVLGWVDADGDGAAGIEKSENKFLKDPDHILRLSIDSWVQFTVQDELKKAVNEFKPKAAIAIVTKIPTGEVLALADWPSFDPNHFGTALPDHRRNRAVTDPYELGSVFKPLTLAMALETGMKMKKMRINVANPLVIAGRKIRDFHPGPSPMDGEAILVHSSNKGAARLALHVGAQRQQEFLDKFGLMVPAQLQLPGAVGPYMASSDWPKIKTATIGYGHGLSVTAASFVAALGGVVNAGNRVPLTLLKTKENQVEPTPIVSVATSHDVRTAMRSVVTEGTGRKANVPGYGVAGKTGSAEKWDPQTGAYAKHRNVSSFVGVFPYEEPQYLVFVLLDEPQGNRLTHGWETAGWNAAPTVGNIIRRIGPLLHAPYSSPDAKPADNLTAQNTGPKAENDH